MHAIACINSSNIFSGSKVLDIGWTQIPNKDNKILILNFVCTLILQIEFLKCQVIIYSQKVDRNCRNYSIWILTGQGPTAFNNDKAQFQTNKQNFENALWMISQSTKICVEKRRNKNTFFLKVMLFQMSWWVDLGWSLGGAGLSLGSRPHCVMQHLVVPADGGQRVWAAVEPADPPHKVLVPPVS